VIPDRTAAFGTADRALAMAQTVRAGDVCSEVKRWGQGLKPHDGHPRSGSFKKIRSACHKTPVP